ncbi:hypothetical protein L9F63_022557, partial [Diploptera punctata]
VLTKSGDFGRGIAVSRVLFLHKHDCSALRQQLRLLLKRIMQATVQYLPEQTSNFPHFYR